MRVVGIRGSYVGEVAEVRDDVFLVEPDEQPPFWLQLDAVVGIDGNRVELICDTSEVRRYMVPPSE